MRRYALSEFKRIHMDIEWRRTLYTSLRLNWLEDPTIPVEDWQVEDYREMPFSVLFERLRTKNIAIDRVSFLAFGEQHDSPEGFCDELLEDKHIDTKTYDQIYLIVFELWRRLITDKPCLSIFCDELDYQFSLYDSGNVDNTEQMQDILGKFQVILEENTDQGAEPQAVFEYVATGCAHDVESFLLDYIADQIDNENFAYASDLLEGFEEYVSDSKWFELQRARITILNDPRGATRRIIQLIEDSEEDEDVLDFYLEVLHFLSLEGDHSLFKSTFERTIPLIKTEEDFRDLLDICMQFHQTRENITKVTALQNLQAGRRSITQNAPVKPADSGVMTLRTLMTS